MTKTSIGALAISVALFANNANAIGDTEEGILWGLGIYKAWDLINEEPPWEPNSSYGYGDTFPPFKCRGDSIRCAYESGVYEREREEWEDKKTKAYECGRTGRNCEE